MSREPEYIVIKTTQAQRDRQEAIPIPSNDIYDVVFIVPGNTKAQKVPTTYWRVRDLFLIIDDNPAHLPSYPIPEEILVQCR